LWALNGPTTELFLSEVDVFPESFGFAYYKLYSQAIEVGYMPVMNLAFSFAAKDL
jgi:hypothetical protein